jgi:hypothetical protein
MSLILIYTKVDNELGKLNYQKFMDILFFAIHFGIYVACFFLVYDFINSLQVM